MRPTDVYWHIYRRDQMKAELRGHLLYVLEIPVATGLPVVRHIFDPIGREFPINSPQRIRALLEELPHGMLFEGLNKAAVYEVMLWDPRILKEDAQFARYNRELVHSTCRFFLQNPNLALSASSEHQFGLLDSSTAGYLI